MLKARRRLGQILGEIIRERRGKKTDEEDREKDLLDQLLNCRDRNGEVKTLTEEQIVDNIIGVLFAAQDTTASALTWILMYLHDQQNLLESVKVRTYVKKNNIYIGYHFFFMKKKNRHEPSRIR